VRFIHLQYEGKQLGMKNFDPVDPDSNYSLFDVQDRDIVEAGREFFTAPDPVIFVSQNFVMHFHKKTGDRIKLDTPSGVVEFRIIGVVVDFASPEGIIYQPRTTFKKYWKDNLIDAFGVKMAAGVNDADFRKQLIEQVGPHNLLATSNVELRNQISQSVDQSFAYTKAIEGAALLVAALGLLNTFLISIMERKRELGMLRAIGMSRGQMFSLIIKEAIIQGALGAFVAVCFGAWIASMWITGSLAHVLGWIISFTFPWHAALVTVLVGIFVTIASGFYPAWRASRNEIREALEYE
jgi:putative ABC transport system permease protein